MQTKTKKILFISIILLLAICAVLAYLIIKETTTPGQDSPGGQETSSQEKDYTKEDVEEALQEPLEEADEAQPLTPEQKSETQNQVEDALTEPTPESTPSQDYTREDVQRLLSE